MSFHFRQFTVEDEQSTLRVGTDAMLLGSWATPGKSENILDIGTGCGILALMMAQKSEAMIEAIEIDRDSILEARTNFLNSPWASRISAIHDSLQRFSGRVNAAYDFIIANPPYFDHALKSPSSRNNQTRHCESLTFGELACSVSRLLSGHGCFVVILPSETAHRFQEICQETGMNLSRRLVVFPKPDLPPKRILMDFIKENVTHPETSELTILDAAGKFTTEYLNLTKAFHNF